MRNGAKDLSKSEAKLTDAVDALVQSDIDLSGGDHQESRFLLTHEDRHAQRGQCVAAVTDVIGAAVLECRRTEVGSAPA